MGRLSNTCHSTSRVESTGRHRVDTYGTHSLRRTKAAQIDRKTGTIRAVQLLLGHMKADSTMRYVGVALEEVLSIDEKIDV